MVCEAERVELAGEWICSKMFKVTLKRALLYSLILMAMSVLLLSLSIRTHSSHHEAQLSTSARLKTSHTVSPVQTSTRGFMLAFRFWEQQTQGLRNLNQLQCIAHSFSMRVVEPFVVNSVFSFSFSEIDKGTFLELGDLIDVDFWNTNISAQYLPLSTWGSFLTEASRDVIIHCVRYRNRPVIRVPIPGFNFRTGCSNKCYQKFNSSLSYLARFGFRLVRSTCSNFVDYAGSVSVMEFSENVFGKYHPSNVTVLVNEFRGLFGLYRMPLRSICGITNALTTASILPSSRILDDARNYSSRIFKGKPYVGVVVRIERIVLHLHHEVEECSQEVSDILQSLKSKKGVSNVFLAMDVGKFGSHGANRANLQPKGTTMFNAIYGKENWTLGEWEETFSRIAYSDNPAYVANLQRTLAAKGECLIMVGGGGFQGQARSLYETFHPDISQQCVYRVCHTEKSI